MKTNMTSKSEDLPLDYEKSEDPGKMTYSISDFSEQDPRILPRLRELLAKNQDQDLERCESSISPFLNRVARAYRVTANTAALGAQGDAAAQAAHRARARGAIRCDGHVMYLVYVHVYGSRTVQLYHNCRGRWENSALGAR